MKSNRLIVAAPLVLTLATGAVAQEPTPVPDAVAEDATPSPTPTPPWKEWDCTVVQEGEKCRGNLDSEGKVTVGTVSYQEKGSGKWIEIGSGPFNEEGQPHGCGWVLRSDQRLVEERGCFELGKRSQTWKLCRLMIDEGKIVQRAGGCPEVTYEAGRIVFPKASPTPAEEEEAEESAES